MVEVSQAQLPCVVRQIDSIHILQQPSTNSKWMNTQTSEQPPDNFPPGMKLCGL
jgi:hypothetical protein